MAIIINSPKSVVVWIILFSCDMNDERENRGKGKWGNEGQKTNTGWSNCSVVNVNRKSVRRLIALLIS